jgi:hypothetical protein
MDAATRLALTKFKDENARDEVEPGNYAIDSLVRIHGGMTVGKDHEAKQANKIPWIQAFAVALSMLNGVSAEAIFKRAMANELDEKPITEQAQAIIDSLVGTTKQPRKGRVSVSVEVEAIELAPVAKRAA